MYSDNYCNILCGETSCIICYSDNLEIYIGDKMKNEITTFLNKYIYNIYGVYLDYKIYRYFIGDDMKIIIKGIISAKDNPRILTDYSNPVLIMHFLIDKPHQKKRKDARIIFLCNDLYLKFGHNPDTIICHNQFNIYYFLFSQGTALGNLVEYDIDYYNYLLSIRNQYSKQIIDDEFILFVNELNCNIREFL